MSEKAYIEITDDKLNTMTMYGPFPSYDAARKARFFSRPEKEQNELLRNNIGMLFNFGAYDENEVQCLTSDPTQFGFKQVTVKPASELKRDNHWDAYTMDLNEYFAKCFRSYFKRDPKV